MPNWINQEKFVELFHKSRSQEGQNYLEATVELAEILEPILNQKSISDIVQIYDEFFHNNEKIANYIVPLQMLQKHWIFGNELIKNIIIYIDGLLQNSTKFLSKRWGTVKGTRIVHFFYINDSNVYVSVCDSQNKSTKEGIYFFYDGKPEDRKICHKCYQTSSEFLKPWFAFRKSLRKLEKKL